VKKKGVENNYTLLRSKRKDVDLFCLSGSGGKQGGVYRWVGITLEPRNREKILGYDGRPHGAFKNLGGDGRKKNCESCEVLEGGCFRGAEGLSEGEKSVCRRDPRN